MYGTKIEYGEYDFDFHIFNTEGDYGIDVYYGTEEIYSIKKHGNIYSRNWKQVLKNRIEECQKWLEDGGPQIREKRINEANEFYKSFDVPYWNEDDTINFVVHGEKELEDTMSD